MPWGVVAAVGGAAVGAMGTKSAAKSAAKSQQAAIDANAWQGEIAQDQYEEYKKTYLPLERQLAQDATNFDSQANYDKAAASAQSSVSTQMGLAKERLRRTPNLDPSSAAAVAANADLELKGAAMGASEQNKARENISNLAYARKQDAVSLGKGLASNASAGMASAAAGAQSIANAQNASATSTAAGLGSMFSGVIKEAGKADWGALGDWMSGTFGGGTATA